MVIIAILVKNHIKKILKVNKTKLLTIKQVLNI